MPENEFELYLALLAKTLRLNDKQREAIARELRDHLEQRLAELTEAGYPRYEAIKLALDEFGDASALATDLTRPRQHLQRRRIMQSTFGTLAACAAVTFAVMTLTPTNYQGTPTQTSAEAQAQANAEREDAGQEPVSTAPSMLRIVDCTSILIERSDTGTMSERTAALARAVEQTVAQAQRHQQPQIHVAGFEQFLIITADKASQERAQALLNELGSQVQRRAAIEREQRIAETENQLVRIANKRSGIELQLAKFLERRQALAEEGVDQNALEYGEYTTRINLLREQIEELSETEFDLRSQLLPL